MAVAGALPAAIAANGRETESTLNDGSAPASCGPQTAQPGLQLPVALKATG
jgi:hypothetical protein